MLRWFLVHTKPSSESAAEMNLRRQGYAVYLPRVIQSVRFRERWQERTVPLFPRYLFMALNEGDQALAPVHSTKGVAAVIRFGSTYAPVPERMIRELRSRADPESGLHRLELSARLQPGTQVRVRKGPFEGLEGVFEREAGCERVVVLLSVLGQEASVCVSGGAIEMAGTSAGRYSRCG